jgi:ribosomal protein S18 acetylase RimI-like enzyme
MAVRRVRAEDDAIRRFVEECWVPFHDDLSETIDAHSLVEDFEIQDVVAFYRDLLDSPSERLWVALDDVSGPAAPLSTVDATFTGFVQTNMDPSPQTFDWPDRLLVRHCWVEQSARGSGLADDLVTRAVQQAREDGCTELTLKVSTDNERALSYFEGLGFEVDGFRMHVPMQDVTLDSGDSDLSTVGHSSLTLRRLRVEESAMRRFVEECWTPFWEDLGAAVGEDHLSPDLDRDALVEDLFDSYDVPDRRCWIAIDDPDDPTAALDDVEGTFAGWLNAGLEPTDRFLDQPERLFVGNIYAKPAYRGKGLADHLVARVLQYAREEGCSELSLGVEVDNERAMAYYEKLGFEPLRQGMSVSLDEIAL